MAKSDILRRSFPLADLEVRAAGKTPKIEGYALVYDSISRDLGGFKEILKRGCFNKTLTAGAENIFACFCHDPSQLLGTMKAGTLQIEDRTKGLWFSVSPPATQTGKDVVELMRRGDLSECSFLFTCSKEKWRTDPKQGDIREVLEGELFELSLVASAAYAAPSAHLARSFFAKDLGVDIDGLAIAMQRAKAKQATKEDLQLITQFQNQLVSLQPDAGKSRLERILQGGAVAGTMPRLAALIGVK